MDFQLVSDFQPTGDQPQAIDKLTRDLRLGLPHQTLLGVTGSGKSVTGSTPILVRRGASESCEPIGPLIDALLTTHAGRVGYVGDTELLEPAASQTPVEVFSFDARTGRSSWQPVRQFLRHGSPATLTRLTTDCGRSVTVTGDHNFFALRDGRLQLLPTGELRVGDYLPLPRQIPEPDPPLTSLPLDEQLDRAGPVYVSVNSFADAWSTYRSRLRPLLSPPKSRRCCMPKAACPWRPTVNWSTRRRNCRRGLGSGRSSGATPRPRSSP
jgi:hypothetical protein